MNRQIGLWYYDEVNDEFKPDARGVVVMNPQDANANLWPGFEDLFDHVGSMANIFTDTDGRIYLPITIKAGVDYATMIVELLLN